MTIKELKKIMMLSKKDNKIKSDVYMLILDKAQKIAKTEKRAPKDSDVITASKQMLKQSEQSRNFGMNVDAEIEILKQFMPKMMNDDEIESAVNQFIKDVDSPSMGLIMKSLKSAFGDIIDMKMASSIVKKSLKSLS